MELQTKLRDIDMAIQNAVKQKQAARAHIINTSRADRAISLFGVRGK